MSGQIIVITNQKGGPGKTTLSVHLAAGLTVRGYNALIAEADEQGSASQWSRIGDGLDFPVEPVSKEGPSLPRRIVELASRYDFVVVDGIPRADQESLVSLLGVADLAIAPCKPAVLDVWSTEAFFAKAKADVETINPNLKIAIILNMVNKSRKNLLSAIEMMIHDPARRFPVYKTTIGDRGPIASVPALGTTVLALSGVAIDAARTEMDSFVDETIQLLKGRA